MFLEKQFNYIMTLNIDCYPHRNRTRTILKVTPQTVDHMVLTTKLKEENIQENDGKKFINVDEAQYDEIIHSRKMDFAYSTV